jgi:hypothetical protein
MGLHLGKGGEWEASTDAHPKWIPFVALSSFSLRSTAAGVFFFIRNETDDVMTMWLAPPRTMAVHSLQHR